ncbi:MAG: PEGA domain-containing protein, partial [Candidatus Saccharimonadales bacterium]|nr:PEGA domain-containing protein [Candidatus Saccharimonadales bacterium]
MLNFDFGSKRAKKTQRFVTYGLSTVFVIGFTIVLVLATLGYDIDRGTGEVIQNGLVLVNSEPSGSLVTIDGNPESDDTPGRFSVPEGIHTIRVNRDGYHEWTKSVSVQGSEVVWLYYPLLIPVDAQPKAVTTTKNLEFIAGVPDGKRFLIRQKSNLPRFKLIEVSKAAVTNEEVLELPEGIFTSKKGKLGSVKIVGWADGDDKFLVRHKNGSINEYVVIDTNNVEESINLTEAFDLPLREVRFINDDADKLYALVNENLRRLDIGSQTISAPLVESVKQYTLHTDKYITFLKSGDDGSAEVGLIDGNQDPRILDDLPGETSDYQIASAEYDGTFHLATLDTASGNLNIKFDPQKSGDQDQFNIQLAEAKFLSFSGNGRFVMAQSGNSFALYDFDEERRHTFKTDISLSGDEVKWFDGHRLTLVDKDNVAYLSEFDGTNVVKIGAIDSSINLIYNSGQKFIYSVAPPSKSGVQL